MNLVIEVREVVLERPLVNLFRAPVGMPVVVVAVAIPLVQPLLVLTLQLVIKDDSLDTGPALLKAFSFTFVRAIDLRRRARVLSPSALQQAPPFLRQHDRVVAIARHAHGFDQPLFAGMPQVA